MIRIIRYLLLPLVPIYYVVTWVRNKLYDLGIKKSVAFDLPVIAVGNLSVGGTGKTPMIEHLLRILQSSHLVATLSRGYKRQSKGFILADENATALSLGDEPYQIFNKFKDILVSVDADRVNGINQLRKLPQPPEIILLDDAYQHRKVKAGLYILLTSYHDLYTSDLILPTGNLREPRSGADRADIIVITKCPETISENDKKIILGEINPLPHQHVFFATIAYAATIINAHQTKSLSSLKSQRFTLVTGIANPMPLVHHLKKMGLQFEHLNYKDHHDFNPTEIAALKQKQLILTTEKDMVRLQPHFKDSNALFYLPIEIRIQNEEKFNTLISKFVK